MRLQAAKGAFHEEIVEANDPVRQQVQQARDMVARGLSDARVALKSDIWTAIAATK